MTYISFRKMTMDDLIPSDEDKPYVTETEEDTETVSKHKRKTIIKRLQKTKPAKQKTNPKPANQKKSQKRQTKHDTNDTTPQQPEPQQCMST